MKSKYSFVTILYWLFRIGFVVQILVVIQLFYYMFFFSKDGDLAIKLSSDLRVFADTLSYQPVEHTVTDNFIDAKVFRMSHGKGALVYKELGLLNVKGVILLLIEIVHIGLWLVFTWMLMQIFHSLKQQDVFMKENIKRLQIIALIVGLSPIVMLLHNILFADLIGEAIIPLNHRFAYYYDYSLFFGIFYMFLILLIVKIFSDGIRLKQENDLTI